MLERDYTNAEPAKPPPPIPVRVSRKSQLMAALRQNARPIVIEDHDLARRIRHLPDRVGGEVEQLLFEA